MAQLKDYSIPELIHLLGSRYRDYLTCSGAVTGITGRGPI